MKKMMIMAAACLMAAMTFAAQCAAMTKKGTQCKRQASPGSAYCWQHGGARKAQSESAPVAAPAPAPVSQATTAVGQCKGMTASGKRCSHKAQPGSDYCWQHGATGGAAPAASKDSAPAAAKDSASRRNAKTAAKTPEVDSRAGFCAATTADGKPCGRNAKPGSKFCWQHDATGGAAPTAAKDSAPAAAKDSASRRNAKTAAKTPEVDSRAGFCAATTADGKPCGRKAKPGSKFCWQHAK